MEHNHTVEITQGLRFEFGANWDSFLKMLNEDRIDQAVASLMTMLGVTDLKGKRFVDAGSGSGLFSLAARRLGAMVHSFDYDPKSVACTQELKRRYLPGDPDWIVEEGSVLDRNYLAGLGQFDVVYSWGVLHHTGAMWQALENVTTLIADGGRLFIAIYNDQGMMSRYWRAVKKTYVRYPLMRWPLLCVHTIYPWLPSWFVRALTGRLPQERGMSMWYDLVDWIGGYPFEVARPDVIVRFYRDRGMTLQEMKATCRHGCNEFMFVRESAAVRRAVNKPAR